MSDPTRAGRRRAIARRLVLLVAALAWLVGSAPAQLARTADPIVYTVRLVPDSQAADVQATIPTGKRASIELMMPVWSPGFYRVENYAARVQDLAARTPGGKALRVDQPRKNRWQIETGGSATVVVSYRVACAQRSVTTNWVSADLAVLNGAPTFLTLVERIRRPHDVRLELPPTLTRAMTALDPAPDGVANHYRAEDFDTLVDSPIVAGDLDVHQFDVGGSRHYLVDAGDRAQFDGARAAGDLQKIVAEARRLWGFLPYKKYVFLNVFRQGGGGLEHKDSTLLTASAARATTPAGYRSWLSFVAHEYFHAFNVKRLRPIELGPFDYENEPHTKSLWISEGFTSYYATLLLGRSGLDTSADFLAAMSSPIRQLQQAPGRLVQALEQSSWDVWSNSTSGVNTDPKTSVSYYVKGEVVGFLLDARVRRATGGAKSLDDVMRLAYKRYAGARGFTPDEFRKTAEDVARTDLREWFRRAVSSTEELDYDEALDWFGLRFAARDGQDPSQNWKLEGRDEATETQKSHLRALLAPSQSEPPFANTSFISRSRKSLSSVRVTSAPPRACDVTSVLNETM
jgi:predicted metalloprotease with PDZ domain